MNRDQRRSIVKIQFTYNYHETPPDDVVEALCDWWEKSQTAPSFVEPVMEAVIKKDPNNYKLMRMVVEKVRRK